MQSFKYFLAEREEAQAQKGVEVHGIHYSNRPNLSALDGRFSGSGIKGAEQKRLGERGADPRIKKRVYFYNKEATHKPVPNVHEQGLGQHTYSAHLGRIYDPEKATPEQRSEINTHREKHIYNGAEHSNAFESAVLDSGYHGYTNRGMTVVMNHHEVPVKYHGLRSDVLRKGSLD